MFAATRGGRRAGPGADAAPPLSAYALLGQATAGARARDRSGPDGPSGVEVRSEVRVPADLLADLYHPRLVITPDYIGPDRRRAHRNAGRVGEGYRDIWHLVLAVVMVLAVAAALVPLSLLAAREVGRSVPTPSTGGTHPRPGGGATPRSTGAAGGIGRGTGAAGGTSAPRRHSARRRVAARARHTVRRHGGRRARAAAAAATGPEARFPARCAISAAIGLPPHCGRHRAAPDLGASPGTVG